MSCCFSCIIQDITFIQYGLTSYNLIGNSYLHNIKIIQFSQLCCRQILLQYTTCQSQNNYSNYIHNVTINQIFIQGNTTSFMRLYIHWDHSEYHLKILLQNSYFTATNQTALKVQGGSSLTTTQLYIINCTFKYITDIAIIIWPLSPINKNVSFINCDFHGNMKVIQIIIALCKSFNCELLISNATFPMILTNISFVSCRFIDNRQRLLLIENRAPALGKVTLLLSSLYILHNTYPTTAFKSSLATKNNLILILTMNVYIVSTFTVTKNRCELSIMHFQSCDILLSGKTMFNKNNCAQVILLNTYIKVMEYTNITFKDNTYYDDVISISKNAEE